MNITNDILSSLTEQENWYIGTVIGIKPYDTGEIPRIKFDISYCNNEPEIRLLYYQGHPKSWKYVLTIYSERVYGESLNLYRLFCKGLSSIIRDRKLEEILL